MRRHMEDDTIEELRRHVMMFERSATASRLHHGGTVMSIFKAQSIYFSHFLHSTASS